MTSSARRGRAGKAGVIAALGATPVVVDVFDAQALARAVKAAAPQAVMHQLTDLPSAPGTPGYEAGLERNARLRIEGTRNLVAAARAANVTRMVAQSIAFVYAPGPGARVESDPLMPAEGMMARTVAAVGALEEAVLAMSDGIVLRYGFFYGPGTWSGDAPARKPARACRCGGAGCRARAHEGQAGHLQYRGRRRDFVER